MLVKLKNRIIDRFQGHLFDIKNNLNTTVARHFGSHIDRTDPNMTIHILEYIRLPKDYLGHPHSETIGNCLDSQTKHFNPKCLNILD